MRQREAASTCTSISRHVTSPRPSATYILTSKQELVIHLQLVACWNNFYCQSVTRSETMDTTAADDYFPSLPLSILVDVMNLGEGFSGDKMLEFIDKSKAILNDLHNNDSTMLFTSSVQLGILCALTLSMRTTSVKMTGQWEDVLWGIIDLAPSCEPDNDINLSALESVVKPWILTMFADPEMCPNPYLRLRMVHLIHIWPETFLQDAASGMQAAAGLVINGKYMDRDHLCTDDEAPILLHELKDMLVTLDEYGHLDGIGDAAVDQLTRINVGPEVSLLYNLMKVLKQMAEESLNLIGKKRLYMTEHVIHLYMEFVDLRKLRKAYRAPGLAKVVADTLVAITVSFVTIGLTLEDIEGNRYKFFADLFDSTYKSIRESEIFSSVYQVLRLDHAQYLSSLGKKAADSNIFFHHFPVPYQESSEEVPEEFRDSVTLAVMEAPVLLHSSKMVTDESTLIRLLLESGLDPFTRCPLDQGSYSRLPQLQADILAWKETTKLVE